MILDLFAISLAARWFYLFLKWCDVRDRAKYLCRLAWAKEQDDLRSRAPGGSGQTGRCDSPQETPSGKVAEVERGVVAAAPSAAALAGEDTILSPPARAQTPVDAGVSRGSSRPPAHTSAGAGAGTPTAAPAGLHRRWVHG